MPRVLERFTPHRCPHCDGMWGQLRVVGPQMWNLERGSRDDGEVGYMIPRSVGVAIRGASDRADGQYLAHCVNGCSPTLISRAHERANFLGQPNIERPLSLARPVNLEFRGDVGELYVTMRNETDQWVIKYGLFFSRVLFDGGAAPRIRRGQSLWESFSSGDPPQWVSNIGTTEESEVDMTPTEGEPLRHENDEEEGPF